VARGQLSEQKKKKQSLAFFGQLNNKQFSSQGVHPSPFRHLFTMKMTILALN